MWIIFFIIVQSYNEKEVAEQDFGHPKGQVIEALTLWLLKSVAMLEYLNKPGAF